MLYDRTWFRRNGMAVTIGGGQLNNPGRYLTLLPPINDRKLSEEISHKKAQKAQK